MYISGLVVAFILSFITYFLQGLVRIKEENNQTFVQVVFGAFFGAAITSILSWITVAILIVLYVGGGVKGLSDRNL